MSSSAMFGLPSGVPKDITLSQFMTQYNPDGVPSSKVIHTDTIASKSITYGSVRSLAAQYAYSLRNQYSVKLGDVVLCLAPNSSDFVLLAHSVWWCGAIFSSMNTASTSKDVAHAMRLVKPSYLCIYPEYLDAVLAAVKQTGQSPQIFTMIEHRESYPLFPTDFASESSLPPFSCASPSTTPCTINFSSGTTSAPKAVAHSHTSLIANTLGMRRSSPQLMNAHTREAFFPPYCHVYGLVMVLMNNVFYGNFTCGMHKFELEEFCRLMQLYDANWAHIVPPVALQLAKAEVVKNYDLHLERIIIAGAAVKKELQQQLRGRFGSSVKILQGYGMTECPTVTHQDDGDEDVALGSVGKPIDGTIVKLVDVDTGKLIEDVGREGQLWVQAPQVTLGYYNDAKSTKSSFSDDGKWLRTGDILTKDKNGYYWVTDRLKEMIKYKGLQVPPSELEGVLLQHEDVIDSAVCSGYDDAQATEIPVAYVVLKSDIVAAGDHKIRETLAKVRQFVDNQVAPYKKLRGGVHYLPELPKTASGKILRKDLPVKVAQRKQSKI